MKIRIHHRRSKSWLVVQRVFLAAGLLGIGLAVYSYASRYVYQAYANREFERALAARNVAPPKPHASAKQHPFTVGPRALIGRIAIPRLGISAVVKQGIDDRTLDLAVGHIPSTAMPGETGNVGLAAHRDNLFRSLKDVQWNDEITVTTLDNTYIYRVTSFTVVNPEEVSVLAPQAGERMLTLVTCYPFYFVGHAPKRFIVRARQVSTPVAPAGYAEGGSRLAY